MGFIVFEKQGFIILQGMALLLLKSLDLPTNYSLNLIILITNPKNKIWYLMNIKAQSFIKKYPLSILLGIMLLI